MKNKKNTKAKERNSKINKLSKRKTKKNQVPKEPKNERGRTATMLFTCECGSSYLSYPALYKHRKVKHVNEANNGKGNIKRDAKDVQDTFEAEYLSFLDLLPRAKQGCERDLSGLQGFAFSFMNTTNPNVIRFMDTYKDIVRQVKQTIEDNKSLRLRQALKQHIESRKPSISEALCVFLVYNYALASKEFFNELAVLLLMVNQVIDDCVNKTTERDLRIASSKGLGAGMANRYDINLIVELSNEIVLGYKTLWSVTSDCIINASKMKYLGQEPEHILNFVMLFRYLCSWLYDWGLTNKQLSFVNNN